MKKALAVLLSFTLLLSGCSSNNPGGTSSENEAITTELTSSAQADTGSTTDESSAEQSTIVSSQAASNTPSYTVDARSEKYINTLGFSSLNDRNLQRYVEDAVYADLVNQLDSDEYLVQNVESIYISREYIDELNYNSQENLYFGYKLSELDEAFQGEKYIFTLGKDGQTDVVPFEEYDDTFEKVIRNVAIGSGVILLCVTVAPVAAAAGAPAVSLVFAASAKTATVFALQSGLFSGVAAGVAEGIKTHDFDSALKEAALKGSEGFMWGAITGAITGGIMEAKTVSALQGSGVTSNGLTIYEAERIQKDSKYPLDVIKQFSSMEQYEICKEAGLTAEMVSGKTALIRNIDLNFVDEATGLTNLERMQKGLAALDPSGTAYELHHIGQKADSTLAILSKAEHMQNGNNKIWHTFIEASEAHAPGNTWDAQRMKFWKDLVAGLTA